MEDSGGLRDKEDGVIAAGEAEGRGDWDGLINRVSDSTHSCPWDISSRAHRRSAASGNCRVMRAYSPL